MIKKIIVNSNEIEENIDNRFSPKYFLITHRLKELENNPNIDMDKLANLVEYIISGSYISKYCDEGTPYLRVSDIKTLELDLNPTNLAYINESEIKVPNKIKVNHGDIVIGRTAVLGIASLVNELSSGYIISQHVTRLKPHFLPGYFVAVLNSVLFKKQMEIASYGITRLELTHAQLGETKIPILKKHQRKQINDLMLLADKKHIAAMNKISIAKEIFEKEININYFDIPEEKTYSVSSEDLENILTPKFYFPKYLNVLKELKKRFKTIKLGDGDIGEIQQGSEVGSDNYKNYVEKTENDVPFIRTSDLINYEVDSYPDYYIDEEIFKFLRQDLKEGDILFTKDGKIGLSAMMTKADRCIISSGIARIRLNPSGKIDPYYIFLALSTVIGLYQALQRVVIASTLPHLQLDRLGEIEIPLIEPEKQREISNLIKEAFQLKAEKKILIKEALNKIDKIVSI